MEVDFYFKLSNIRDPFAIGLIGFKVSFQQVWSNLSFFTFVGIVLSPCTNLTDQAKLFHEFSDGLVIYTNVVVMQFLRDPAIAVAFFILMKDGDDLFFYHLVLCRILRFMQIVIKGAARRPGKLQQRFQGIFLP